MGRTLEQLIADEKPEVVAKAQALAADIMLNIHLAELREKVWPLLERGVLKPQIFKTFPLEQAAAAHALMESSEHIGKIMLTF